MTQPARLHLSSLALHHFRNYEGLRLEFSSDPVVLFGHNGAGKTNILEALSLLVPGRGLRRAALSDLAHAGHDPQIAWAVVAQAHGIQGPVTLATGRDLAHRGEGDRRRVQIDASGPTTQLALAEHLRMLWLTPQLEQLFLEGASEGRKFLDRLVYSFDAGHAAQVHAYEQAMRERNRLLESPREDPAWLDVVERTMAEHAASIAAARLLTLQHLNHVIGDSQLSFPKPHLAVTGWVEERLASGTAAIEVEHAFCERLASDRTKDRLIGRTMEGVHRSQLLVTHRTRGISASLCSTGEQKALLLSVMLAQLRACGVWSGIVPMLLLDEVVAHLDPNRRVELFEEITDTGAQVWMSGTDRSLFHGIEGRAQMLQIQDGKAV